MKFEGLVVLALDLEFGLKFFDKELEARNFHPEFLSVGGSANGARRSGLHGGRGMLRDGRWARLR